MRCKVRLGDLDGFRVSTAGLDSCLELRTRPLRCSEDREEGAAKPGRGRVSGLLLSPARLPARVSAPDEPKRPLSNVVSAKTKTQSGLTGREDQRLGFYFWAERQVLGGSWHLVLGRTEGRRAVWRPQLCSSSSQMRHQGTGTTGLGT